MTHFTTCLEILKQKGIDMTSRELAAQLVIDKVYPETTEIESLSKNINTALYNSAIKQKLTGIIRVDENPNVWRYSTEIQPITEEKEQQSNRPLMTNGLGARIKMLLENVSFSELRLENEHELELVVWGAISTQFPEVRWRGKIANGTADMQIDGCAIECKYLKTKAEKDRLVGQVMDYLKMSPEVVVIAVDNDGMLKGLFKDPRITSIRC
jgi:hypothetical protein